MDIEKMNEWIESSYSKQNTSGFLGMWINQIENDDELNIEKERQT